MTERIQAQPLYLRERDIVAPSGFLPISRSTWWAGVKSGRYPRPVKLGPRITAWSRASLDELITQLNAAS